MELSVNPAQRYAKMRAHTATHLLHAKLIDFFPNTKQAGSLVDNDLLRFDFYADTLLSSKQLKELENSINQRIYGALPVSLLETSFEEALKLWAKAFFEEKYENEVRLIRIQDGKSCISAELCGGTHVQNTREIGAFSILSQEAVASGIKRITALTGPKIIEKIQNEEHILDELLQSLDVKSYTQINEKTTKFLKEYHEMKSKLESLEIQMLTDLLTTIPHKKNADFEIILPLPSNINIKSLPNLLKHKFPATPSLLAFTDEGSYLILTDNTLSAKTLAQKYQLKWGGSESMFQGRDPSVLTLK